MWPVDCPEHPPFIFLRRLFNWFLDMKQAIIFDMDGLMFDTEAMYSRVFNMMAEKRGKVFTNDIKTKMMGARANEAIGILADAWGEDAPIDALLAEQDELLVELYKTEVEKLPGLDAFIEFLKNNNIRMCIGTSSRMFLVDILLDRFNLRAHFEHVISGDMVERGKPAPDIYHLCLEKLGLPGGQCLVLEDSHNGMLAGKAAGCQVCAIPSEYTRHQDFSEADIIVDSLGDERLWEYVLKV
jgi:HAD superfamily hydrolase (TIGR01509 family)